MFRFISLYLWFCYVLSIKAFDIYARHFEYSCMRCFVIIMFDHRWPKRNMRVCMGNKEFET